MSIVMKRTITHKGDSTKNQYCEIEGQILPDGKVRWYSLWKFCPYCGERLPEFTHEVR